MRGITNKQRIAEYDSIKTERDTLDLALFDVLNGRFSAPVRVNLKDYDKTETGYIKVSVSMRGMPLFLVHGSNNHTAVYTEHQVELFEKVYYTTFDKAIAAAFAELKRQYYPKVA